MRRLVLGMVLACGLGVSAGAAENHWRTVAADVSAAIDGVVAAYTAGDEAAARRGLTEAYFAKFEDSKMEAAIRREIGKDRAISVEGLFADIRRAMKAGDRAEVDKLAATLRTALAEDGKVLDDAKVPPEVFAVNQ